MAGDDHRPRVAAERRERTRARLVESALLVFAEKGVDASVIDDVITAAQVSRGTFYNYFRTNEELLAAVSEELGNETMRMIEAVVGADDDPARRVACGLRLFLHLARALPHFARFSARAGLNALGPNNLAFEYLPNHIGTGMKAGRFATMPLEIAVDMVAGATLMGLFRLSSGEAAADYPEQIVSVILQGLGMTRAGARQLVVVPLKPLEPPADSLLLRSAALYQAAGAVAT